MLIEAPLSRICFAVQVSCVWSKILFYKGIGAYNTLLVYPIFAPFTGNGSDIGLEALQIAIIVNLFGDVSPLADFCGITDIFRNTISGLFT